MADRLTRREVLVRGVAASLLVALAGEGSAMASPADLSSETGDLVTGTIARVTSPRSVALGLSDGGAVDVVLSNDAEVMRGHHGLVGDLSSFVPGDRVVATGERTDSTFLAGEFQTLYNELHGSVLHDDGNTLTTSVGTLRVPIDARGGSPNFEAGDEFSAGVWQDPTTADIIAVAVRRL